MTLPPQVETIVRRVREASDWNERVQEIRRIPELFGERQRRDVYAAIASSVYKPHLAAQFAYVQWSETYELEPFRVAYERAQELTEGFEQTDASFLAGVLEDAPETLRIFRTIVGYTPRELAIATSEVAEDLGLGTVSAARVNSMEKGNKPPRAAAQALAEAVHRLVTGTMWEVATTEFRSKLDKPDTEDGWSTVRQFARSGAPYYVLLHQRHYGGAFRTLLDATGALRGEALLEQPVERLLQSQRVSYLQTGAHNQREIETRFGLTVRPAPDFVVFEGERTLRAMIECKQANDGGTARDKASRFATLAREGRRLGGVPVFAVIDGLGWERTADALGPVVRDTDGRAFTLKMLPEILTVEPFPTLIAHS